MFYADLFDDLACVYVYYAGSGTFAKKWRKAGKNVAEYPMEIAKLKNTMEYSFAYSFVVLVKSEENISNFYISQKVQLLIAS